jgi:hypothetical protein
LAALPTLAALLAERERLHDEQEVEKEKTSAHEEDSFRA